MDKVSIKISCFKNYKWDESNEVVDGSKQFNSGSVLPTNINVNLVKCNYTYTCDIINPYNIYSIIDPNMNVNQTQIL